MPSRPTKLYQEIIKCYRVIRALHTCYYTQLEANVSTFSTEFYYLVGDILEGKPIDESQLRYIDFSRVKEFLKEDHREVR